MFLHGRTAGLNLDLRRPLYQRQIVTEAAAAGGYREVFLTSSEYGIGAIEVTGLWATFGGVRPPIRRRPCSTALLAALPIRRERLYVLTWERRQFGA